MNTTTKRWAARAGTIGGDRHDRRWLHLPGPASGSGWSAKAVLRDANGVKVGIVRFDGDAEGTDVKVNLHGIAVGLDTFHGIHLHANDSAGPCDPAGGFTNVGGHWNPSGGVHGSHAGDLPSVLVQADGTGHARTVTARFEPSDVAGPGGHPPRRARQLRQHPDALHERWRRRVRTRTTQGTGDAGGRIACGVIVLD